MKMYIKKTPNPPGFLSMLKPETRPLYNSNFYLNLNPTIKWVQ